MKIQVGGGEGGGKGGQLPAHRGSERLCELPRLNSLFLIPV